MISTVASPGPGIITINWDWNDPTMHYRHGRQDLIFLPSLNDLNLPHNPFNILATMAVMQAEPNTRDEVYSPQSPEPSKLSPISTLPMNFRTIDGWETPHTTTDENTFASAVNPEESNGKCCRTRPSSRNPDGSCDNNAPHLHRRHSRK